MNYNICFVANYTKTDLFLSIGEGLRKNGVNVFWVAVNRRIYNELKAVTKERNILLLNMEGINQEYTTINEENNKNELYNFNDLIFGDRALKFNQDKAYRFLSVVQQKIKTFISANDISFVFGELTWAHEVLIHRICHNEKHLNCRYYNPHTIRIPNGRFGFFEDEFQSTLMKQDRDEIVDISDILVEKPDYLYLNDKIQSDKRRFSQRLSKIVDFITARNKDVYDPTMIGNKLSVFKLRFIEEFNKETYRFVKTFDLSHFEGMDIVYLGLHKQPEASIDVIGRYYEDQYVNIINLWRNLPKDWILLVKEHTNAIGDRSLFFYRKVAALRGVFLLDEKTNSYDVIAKSRLIATVSGTMAYEAAMMGVPAITFAPTFFNKLSLCRKVGLDDLANCEDLSCFINEKNTIVDDEFKDNLINDSFKGIISDYLSDPRCMNSDNIQTVTKAFYRVITSG